MNDRVRFGIIAFANAVVPGLVLLGVVDWDDKQVAAVVLMVTEGISLLALMFPQGQEGA